VPVTTATGAVGSVTGGTDKRITWDAGVDWNGRYNTQMRFRVLVDDLVAPTDFVTVLGGTLPVSSPLGAVAVGTFYVGKYEVQWGEFQTVRTWAASNGYDIGAVGAGTGSNYPVTNVNWYQAVKWCNARSEMEGKTPVYLVNGAVYRTGDSVPVVDANANGYRLPLEKEWEWAARGGLQSQGYTYSGGNTIDTVAWYDANSGGATKVVGTKAANELGIYDMSGNVYEWCWDASGANRRWRGGGWNGSAIYCPVVNQNSSTPTSSVTNRGFRVVLSSVP
jgi:formylglycine-generating enzyme required for sulfatase activity